MVGKTPEEVIAEFGLRRTVREEWVNGRLHVVITDHAPGKTIWHNDYEPPKNDESPPHRLR